MAGEQELAKLIISLQGDIRGLKGAYAQASSQTKDFTSKTKNQFSTMGGELNRTLKGVAGALGVTFGIAALKRFGDESVKLYKRQVDALAILRSQLGYTNKALEDYASELQSQTTFGDEAILEAEAMIASFVKEESQIKKLLPVILDFATAKRLNLASAADLVTKSVSSTTNSLTRYGIQIEGAAGSSERIEMAVKALGQAFGGAAQALAQTDVGKIEQLKNLTEDIQENIGKELVPMTYEWNKLLFEAVKLTAWILEGFSNISKEVETKTDAAVQSEYEKGIKRIDNKIFDLELKAKLYKDLIEKEGNDAAQSNIDELERTEQAIERLKGAKVRLAKESVDYLNKVRGLGAPTPPGKPAPDRPTGKGGTDTISAIYTDAMKQVELATKEILANLDQAYADGRQSAEEYYQSKADLARNTTEQLIAVMEDELAATKDTNKQQEIRTKIYETRVKLEEELLDIESKRAEAQAKIAENETKANEMIINARTRVLETTEEIYREELRELESKHNDEIEALKKLTGDKEQIEEMYRIHKLEKDKLLADQEARMLQNRLAFYSDTFSSIMSLMDNLQEYSGKKNKAMFAIWKAASIAHAIVNTAAATIAAYKSGIDSGIPYPYNMAAGIAAGIVATAAGAIQVGKIASTKMKKGGMLHGRSHSSGGIPVEAEGGEFFEPRDSVQYYGEDGVGFLEAFRRRAIPRGMFKGFSRYSPAYAGSFAQEGGLTSSNVGGGTTVVNFIDETLFNRYLATTRGQKAILNVIAANSYEVRRMTR